MTQHDVPWWMQQIVGPLIVSLLLGAGGAYVGARVALARYDERISEVRQKVEKNRHRIEAHDRRIRELQSLIDSRLTQLETKIDLLLDNKLDISSEDNSP